MGKTKLKKTDCVPPLHKWIVGQGCFTVDGHDEPAVGVAPVAKMLEKTKHKKGECLPPGLEWIVGKGCFQSRKMPATPPRRVSPVQKSPPRKSPEALGRKTSKKKADCVEPFKWMVGKGCFEVAEPQPVKRTTREKILTPPRIPTPPRAPKGKANIVLGNPADFSEGKWAIFDFDGTLVRPKGAHVFPTDKNDWAWWSDSVPLVLKRMHNEGYNLTIRSDQSKDWKIDMITDVVKALNLPVLVLIAMDKANYKPDINLFFDTIGWMVDLDTSIYVGDAAGRQGDWSDVDRGFATNAGIGKFFTPEQVFANEKPKIPVPTSEPKPAATKEDVVIMTGIPGSGKTTWTLNNLPNFYRVSGHQLKTQPKMVSAAETAYKEGARKFVFDATNATPEHRKVYIDWAKKHGMSSKCVFVNTEVKEAIRRNELKADPTPKIAIYVTLKKLTVPKESEGCTVQIISDGRIDFAEAKKSPPKPKAGAPQPEKSTPGALQPGFGVMLAKNFEPGIDPSGWWFSEKLDGMRAIWTGSKLTSRNGNEISIPDWFRSWMPTHPLDGELFTKRGDFQHIVSIVRKIVPVDSEWRQIKYMIFDLPAEKSPFEKRYEKLHEVVAATCGSDGACPLQVVSQTRIADFEDLQRMHKALVAKGAEGSMLRKPGSAYENKRSSSLLKLKDFDEADAVVTGAELGTGKYQNVMGYLSAKLRDEPNITFDIGSGFTDAQRRDYKKLFPVGTIIRVTFNGRTNAGKPRFPVFDGIHIDR